jgi:hypothetical protein
VAIHVHAHVSHALPHSTYAQLKEYDGKKLVCVTKEGLELDDDEDVCRIPGVDNCEGDSFSLATTESLLGC